MDDLYLGYIFRGPLTGGATGIPDVTHLRVGRAEGRAHELRGRRGLPEVHKLEVRAVVAEEQPLVAAPAAGAGLALRDVEI